MVSLILPGRKFFTLDKAKTALDALFLTTLRWWFQLRFSSKWTPINLKDSFLNPVPTLSISLISIWCLREVIFTSSFFIFEENIYGFRRIQSQFVCFKPIFYFRELKISKSYKSCKLFEESCIVVSSAKRIVKNFDDLGRSFIYSMKRLCTRVLAMIKMSDLQPYTLKTFVWSIIH